MQGKLRKGLGEILKPIEEHLQRVEAEIRAQLSTGLSLLDSGSFHLFQTGGKRIRASLIILTGGLREEGSDPVIEMAAAAEIIHCASLIHDDIIDHSIIRRGIPTVSKVWGNKVAVLVGDYMYTRALGTAIGQKRRDIFPTLVRAASDMVKGELYQLEYSNIDRISKEHYFNIIELKTARFMAACMLLGAALGNMDERECELLYGAGLNLGFAFQIVDDALDVMDVNDRAGKASGNDFQDGKITLPLLHLLENADAGERETLIEYTRQPDAVRWAHVRERIRKSGAVDYCIEVANQYNAKVIEALNLIPGSPYVEIIRELSKFLVERNY